MAEELLLYVESDETPYPGGMPLRFPFEDGATRQAPHPVYELDDIEAVATNPDPGSRYTLRIGGIEHPPSSLLSGGLRWGGQKLLANFRGWVSVQIARIGPGGESSMVIEILCRPSKITEDQYEAMVMEIEAASKGLILDVMGARAGFGWSQQNMTTPFRHTEEHAEIGSALNRIRAELGGLQSGAALQLKVDRERVQKWSYNGLDHRSLNDLISTGVDPRDPSSRPFLCSAPVRSLTAQTHENQQIGRFLMWLRQRLGFIAQMMEAQMELIDEDRWWKDLPRPDGRSIWETEDEPRRRRLEQIIESCNEHRRSIWRDMREYPFLQADAKPMDLRPTALFLRHPVYSTIYRVMLSFLRQHGNIFDRANFEMQARVKGTDKLYEYWTYLNMLRYLTERGRLKVEEYGSLYERSAQIGAYTLHIERSSALFRLDETRTLRLLYTPLIFQREEAARRGLSYYKAGGGLPYSPDFMIEVREEGRLKMGVILDAKYMRDVSREMDDLRKYLTAIRDAETGEPFARSLWLVYVGSEEAVGPPCRAEIHTNRAAFIPNDADYVETRGDDSVLIGAMRFAPRPWEGPDSSLDQLDALFRPLLESLGVSFSPEIETAAVG